MGIDISHLDAPNLPAGETPVEAIVLLKCMDEEGKISYYQRFSRGLSTQECMGMCLTAQLLLERDAVSYFMPMEDPDDDEGVGDG